MTNTTLQAASILRGIMTEQPALAQQAFADAMRTKLAQALENHKMVVARGLFNGDK